jgi:hypothetical protein
VAVQQHEAVECELGDQNGKLINSVAWDSHFMKISKLKIKMALAVLKITFTITSWSIDTWLIIHFSLTFACFKATVLGTEQFAENTEVAL